MYIIFWGSIFTAPSYVAHKHRCALPQPCSMKRDDTEIWNLWGEPSMVRAYRSPLSFDRIKYLYRRTYCGVTKFEILPTSLYLQPAVGPGYLLLGQTLDTRLCSLTFERKSKKFCVFVVTWILSRRRISYWSINICLSTIARELHSKIYQELLRSCVWNIYLFREYRIYGIYIFYEVNFWIVRNWKD